MQEIIGKYGRLKWKRVATLMYEEFGVSSKNHKQCRERWANHLNPSLEKREWTAEEEHYLFFYQRIFGNKWSKIRESIPHRPENSIKNHFYSTLKKQINRFNRSYPEQCVSEDINEIQKNPDLVEFLVNFKEREQDHPKLAEKPIFTSIKSVAVQTEDFEFVGKNEIAEQQGHSDLHTNSDCCWSQWPYYYSFYQNSN